MSKPLRVFFILGWVALLAVFVYRQVHHTTLPPGIEVAAAALSETEDGEQEWFGIYALSPDGTKQKIGYATVLRTETATGKKAEITTYMRLAMQGVTQVMRTESTFLTGPDYRLQYVDFVMRSDRLKFKVIGTVRNNAIDLEIETAGGTQTQIVPLPEIPVMPDDIVQFMVDKGGLQVGNSVELPFFDPMTRRYDTAHVRVAERIEHPMPDGPPIVAFRIVTKMAGAESTSIVDEQGRTLEQNMANVSMVREPRQTALTENWRDKPVDLPEVARVAVQRKIPNAREATKLAVRVSGVDLDDLPIGTGRQTYENGVLTVTAAPPPAKGDFVIPYEGDDEDIAVWLKPEPLIESRDPAIIKKAREIVPVAVDAVTAARAVADWVYKNLEKRPLVSITSAKDVLLIRRGDCNEHASLFTALARALGLPSRIEVGLVYLNGAFYYHAWNSVYVGRWVSIDATFGQFPADATHLRIVSGGLDKQVDLVRVIGAIDLEILEAQ
ncbi:MAG: transglutaminase-like domain-containing protein [Candidatus Lernaella stagnicola]|nr:transglutaminase-like domain-containing protein [Candidatus Lernaella stagnicola]